MAPAFVLQFVERSNKRLETGWWAMPEAQAVPIAESRIAH
jgi:hypothetical protein